MNSHKIVFVQRGEEVPIVTKVLDVQKEGAIGVVVVDDGRCERYDQLCIPGADKSRKEKFGAMDSPLLWSHVHIPVLFTKEDYVEELFSNPKLTRPTKKIFSQREEL